MEAPLSVQFLEGKKEGVCESSLWGVTLFCDPLLIFTPPEHSSVHLMLIPQEGVV